MKKIVFVYFIIFLGGKGYAQLQNPSFENWDAGDPIYWSTSNFYDPGTAIQTTDAHSGNFALNLNVVLDSNGTAIAPYAINNFPLTTMPQVLTFWVKGNLSGNNNLSASFTLTEIDTTSNVLAYGDQTFTSINNVYQYKFVNILPLSGPSLLGYATIYFAINAPVGSSLNVNSSIIIDDLYLGVDNTGLHPIDRNLNEIESVYPNPAEDRTNFIFNHNISGHVTLKVYDAVGNLVESVIDEDMPIGKFKAEINTSQLKQGVYIGQLTTNNGISYSKIIRK
ncbi:MAG TPA: T9SS type A sorting domain-containing protein [Bacteroidia bacterium]|nr:T9SS type A sorting domain-containing protein [Bacteroidia bacterium]